MLSSNDNYDSEEEFLLSKANEMLDRLASRNILVHPLPANGGNFTIQISINSPQ